MLISIHLIAFIIISILVVFLKVYRIEINKLNNEIKLLMLQDKENQKITFNHEYNRAKDFVKSEYCTSTQLLQDKLIIPYEMAKDIMEKLEKEGFLNKDERSSIKEINKNKKSVFIRG